MLILGLERHECGFRYGFRDYKVNDDHADEGTAVDEGDKVTEDENLGEALGVHLCGVKN